MSTREGGPGRSVLRSSPPPRKQEAARELALNRLRRPSQGAYRRGLTLPGAVSRGTARDAGPSNRTTRERVNSRHANHTAQKLNRDRTRSFTNTRCRAACSMFARSAIASSSPKWCRNSEQTTTSKPVGRRSCSALWTKNRIGTGFASGFRQSRSGLRFRTRRSRVAIQCRFAARRRAVARHVAGGGRHVEHSNGSPQFLASFNIGGHSTPALSLKRFRPAPDRRARGGVRPDRAPGRPSVRGFVCACANR